MPYLSHATLALATCTMPQCFTLFNNSPEFTIKSFIDHQGFYVDPAVYSKFE